MQMAPFRRPSQKERRSLDVHHTNHNRGHFEWHGEPDKYIMTFPIHPLPPMQAPFEESMLDATGETGHVPFPNANKTIEARQQLLCKDIDAPELSWNFTYNCHWRHNAKGKFHPLLKTIAQIIFGVHLLHQHLEKSVADVADILLKHVNELDSFLQRANEDIEGSLKDMIFRRKCLKVPMEHVNEFDRLLEDRMYRAQLLDGNVVIERTINRMSGMLNDYLIDMSTFRDASNELDLYLLDIGDAWAYQNEDVGRIYSAMCGNTAGWAQFLQSLVAKAEKLGMVLVQVSSYCNEIEKRCGAASRRSLIASRSSSRNSSNSRDAQRAFRNFANNKPLPMVPNERPPFLPTLPAGSDRIQEADSSYLLPSTRYSPHTESRRQPAVNSDSDESLKRQESEESSTVSPKESSGTDVGVSHPNVHQHSEYYQDALRGHDRRMVELSRADSDVTIQDDRPRLDHQAHLDSEANSPTASKRMTAIGSQGDTSPPLTGKDSAYSSISGGSFASPTATHPRSVSSMSSRPQFGLFPSSTPGTPKHSMSGRHGAMSPALSPLSPDPRATLPPRASTSLDSHAASPRRLLKKTSLSSLKRLFSKKKHGPVDTIAE